VTPPRFLLFVAVLMLSGCINKDDQIVDLSGGVFIVFIALIAFKYASPYLAETAIFQRFAAFLARALPATIYPLAVASAGLVVAGFLLSGIHRVLIFSGFTLGVLTVALRQYAASERIEERKRALEVALTGLGVLFVLFLLWMLGGDLFSGL
jgi:hypothetical protein